MDHAHHTYMHGPHTHHTYTQTHSHTHRVTNLITHCLTTEGARGVAQTQRTHISIRQALAHRPEIAVHAGVAVLTLGVVPAVDAHAPSPLRPAGGEGVQCGVVDAGVRVVVALAVLTVEGLPQVGLAEWFVVVQGLALTAL